MADATGILELFRNWSLVLAGRVDEVRPLLGAREDIILLAENSEAESDREKLEILPKRLTGLKLILWAVRYIWHQFRSPALVSKTVFLPKEILCRLKSQMQHEIDEMPLSEGKATSASENDMLTAWGAQVVASSEPSPRPMTVLTFLNIRPSISQVMNSGGLYIQNMLSLTYTFLSKQMLSGPTGSIAAAHRSQFQKQTRSPQVLSSMRLLRRELNSVAGQKHMFGESESRPMLFNNFIKAEFLKVADFSSAVVRRGDRSEQRINAPGTAITYYYRVYGTILDKVTTFFMLCKDQSGNCWLQCNLRPLAWMEMQRRLDSLME